MTPSRMTVLYDGGCPLCRREINHYRRLAGDRPIDWVDVTGPGADLARFGLSAREALQWFHVIDDAGAMHVGARAFIALWVELPRYRWLAGLCRSLRLAPVLEIVYARFAGWHFRRRCRDGACGIATDSSVS